MPIFQGHPLGLLVVAVAALAANGSRAAEPADGVQDSSQISLVKRERSPFVLVTEEARVADVFRSPRWRAFADALDRELEVPLDRDALESACRKSIRYATLTSDLLLTDGCIREALAKVDPKGAYTPPSQFERRERERRRPRGAMGVELLAGRAAGEPIKVVVAIAGGPAAIAGMQDGDRIEAVDGVSVLPLDLDAILDLLRGEPGSTALVKVERNGQPIELHVQRDVLTFLSARTRRLSDDVLYVRISRFQEGATANQLVSGLLRELADAPGLPKLWVMDLRANRGDSLEEVAAVASLFVPQGQTVLRLSSRAEGLRPVLATADGSSDHPAAGLVADLMRSIPAVVLVDERTANGAEALARILRERLQARIAGSPTANIDNVMKEFNLRSEASMRITVGRILSAAGQRWGPGGVPIDLPLANTPDAKFGDMSRDGLLAGAVERYAR